CVHISSQLRQSGVHCSFFFPDPAPTDIYTLSLHDALPICDRDRLDREARVGLGQLVAVRLDPGGQLLRLLAALPVFDPGVDVLRSEEHTSELQSLAYLVCRLLLEKKKYTLDIVSIPIHRQS